MPIPFAAIGTLLWGCVKPLANPMVWPALAVVGVLGFCKGDNYRDRQWVALVKSERARQEQKLQEADEAAFKIIDRLTAEKEERDARINELVATLANEPKYKRACLSPDVVRDINRALSR